MPATAVPLSLNTLHQTLRKCRGAFGYAALFSLCINLLTLLSAIYSMQVLDRVLSSRSIDTLLMLTLLMIVAMVFLGAFSAMRTLILHYTGAWLERTLGPSLLSQTVAGMATGRESSATQQQRDLSALRQFITGIGITTLFDAPWSIVYLLVIFMINATLGWVALAGCLILIFLGILTEYTTRNITKQAQKIHLHNLSFVEATARQAETVEAMGMWPGMLARWQAQFDHEQQLHENAGQRSALLQAITRSVRMILQIAVTGLGAYLALDNQLTAGGIIAASILAARAFAPFENAIAFWKQFVTTQDAYQRLMRSIHLKPVQRGDIALPVPQGILRVEKLNHHIDPHAPPLLQQVSFHLPVGESVGIIGPSGAGKSTLVRLLIGLTAPTQGCVRLDGYDVSTWNRADLGRSLGYVPQQVELFAGTIAENIARMQLNADTELVIKAAQMANVHELIQRLPLGYDTVWAAASPCLSPGQKQRIALARALYGEPKLIVLDEPNLNLDGEGELALINTLQQLKLMRVTTVVVAHKPAIVGCLDQILVLQKGKPAEYGPREQLLQSYTRPAQVKAL